MNNPSTPRFLAHAQPQVTHYFHYFIWQDYWVSENTSILPFSPNSKFILFSIFPRIRFFFVKPSPITFHRSCLSSFCPKIKRDSVLRPLSNMKIFLSIGNDDKTPHLRLCQDHDKKRTCSCIPRHRLWISELYPDRRSDCMTFLLVGNRGLKHATFLSLGRQPEENCFPI